MPKKYLTSEEAILLFQELPSDDDSIISGEISSDEETVPVLQLSESEDSNISGADEPAVADEPGPSNVEIVRWEKKGKARNELPPFTEYSGPSQEILEMEDHSPLALFLELFPKSIFEKIVFETNLYSTQQGKNFKPVTIEEMYRFVAINLLMGIHILPSIKDYWSSTEILQVPYISKQMGVRRFEWILGHLHLNDNSMQPKKGDKNFDKLYKLRPLLEHLSERFSSVFLPSKNQAIDESMVKFKGRSTLKQYMPKKPIKRGYKIWSRADESGFLCQFEIYTGKTNDIAEKNLGERVVKTLCEQLQGKNHIVYMDNFFSSYNLYKFLDAKNIYACGTVNMTRKNMPKNLAEDKALKRGEFDWATSENIVFIKWRDNRSVHVLCTIENSTDVCKVDRKQKDGEKMQINCPRVVQNYNSHMGFVDHFDHLKSLYEIDRKSKKWWHRLFFTF